jgi:RNA polymerase primary sigma factor
MAYRTPSDRWYEQAVRRTRGVTRDEERGLALTLEAHRAAIAHHVLGSAEGLAYLEEIRTSLTSRRLDVRTIVELEADARVEDARGECLARLARIARLGRELRRRRGAASVRRALDDEIRGLGLRRIHVDVVVTRMAAKGGANARALANLNAASDAAAKARTRLVESHLRLVTAIARRYMDRGLDLPDLVQEGTIGLMRAIDRFDPRHEVTFATYAAWWVRQTIGRALANRARPVRLPGSVEEDLRVVHKQRRHLATRDGRMPTSAEIAARTKLSVGRVDDLTLIEHELCRPMLSFDEPSLDDSDGRAPVDVVADDALPGPEDATIARRLEQHAASALEALAPRERQVLELRYGIGQCGEHTLEDIGRKYGLTRQRILQIASKAIEKLRASRHARPLQSFWQP